MPTGRLENAGSLVHFVPENFAVGSGERGVCMLVKHRESEGLPQARMPFQLIWPGLEMLWRRRLVRNVVKVLADALGATLAVLVATSMSGGPYGSSPILRVAALNPLGRPPRHS